MSTLSGNTLRASIAIATIAGSALAFERLALDEAPSAGWTDSQRVFNLSNNTQLIVDCPGNASCDCKDYRGDACQNTDPCDAVITCARICNSANQVVGGECKCTCLYRAGGYVGMPGFEESCPAVESSRC